MRCPRSCPAQPLQWLASCLWKSSLHCPTDVLEIVLVSSPPPTAGGCPGKPPALVLGSVSKELSPFLGPGHSLCLVVKRVPRCQQGLSPLAVLTWPGKESPPSSGHMEDSLGVDLKDTRLLLI